MKKRNILVYLSGKYSGDIPENIRIARQHAIKIWEAGYTCLCPHNNTIHFEKDCECKYDQYIQGDIVMLKRCDVVFMLPEWEGSNGANAEHQEAVIHNIPIVYSLDELELLSEKILEEINND